MLRRNAELRFRLRQFPFSQKCTTQSGVGQIYTAIVGIKEFGLHRQGLPPHRLGLGQFAGIAENFAQVIK